VQAAPGRGKPSSRLGRKIRGWISTTIRRRLKDRSLADDVFNDVVVECLERHPQWRLDEKALCWSVAEATSRAIAHSNYRTKTKSSETSIEGSYVVVAQKSRIAANSDSESECLERVFTGLDELKATAFLWRSEGMKLGEIALTLNVNRKVLWRWFRAARVAFNDCVTKMQIAQRQ
jgi:DNA-directed RNA polymerase specialized sigma24 family protein